MNGFQKLLTATSLTVAMLFAGAAQAIPISRFDEINKGPAGNQYVNSLVEGAEKALNQAGRHNDAIRVRDLFATNAPNSKESIGMNQFYMTLALVRDDDAKHGEHSDVADVLAMSLDANAHIKLPESFFTLASKLDLKFPPKKH